jgi:hypothetical protein
MARNRYCTGCGETFTKTHHMRNHRRSSRCGGQYLPEELREVYDRNRYLREAKAREERRVASNRNSTSSKLDEGQRQQRNLGRDLRRCQKALSRRSVHSH